MQTGRALSIKGELTADEDVTIDGHFEGSIEIQGHRLVITPGSNVKAAVTADAVTVAGRLEGHVTAERVNIMTDAHVEASLMTGHFALQDGARFNGPVNTERARAAGDVARHRRAALSG
jgi:cytoskeletal protein CcmA (bactofilin family)